MAGADAPPCFLMCFAQAVLYASYVRTVSTVLDRIYVGPAWPCGQDSECMGGDGGTASPGQGIECMGERKGERRGVQKTPRNTAPRILVLCTPVFIGSGWMVRPQHGNNHGNDT